MKRVINFAATFAYCEVCIIRECLYYAVFGAKCVILAMTALVYWANKYTVGLAVHMVGQMIPTGDREIKWARKMKRVLFCIETAMTAHLNLGAFADCWTVCKKQIERVGQDYEKFYLKHNPIETLNPKHETYNEEVA